jgi:hypothetical protein
MRNVSAKSCRENQNTHIFSNLFPESNVAKICRFGQATGENMAHALCMQVK